MAPTDRDVERLEREIKILRETVGTLIAWIAASAGAPISRSEAMQLLRMLDGDR